MASMSEKRKAVALVSGGLDSMLIVKIMERQGIDVIPVNFDIGYGGAKLRRRIRPESAKPTGIDMMREKGIDVRTVDVAEEFHREVLLNPEHGYGKAVNPCIDCKIFMQRRAMELAEKWGADFIITGDVIDQRPMSQRRRILFLIQKEAGTKGKVLRPLCAKLLPPTVPEKEGWVDRNGLYAIEGRKREKQMALADELGFEWFETPAGGCLLTEKQFGVRAFDLMEHTPRDEIGFHELQLIKLGHHYRLSPTVKLITGRNYHENQYLLELAPSVERAVVILDAQDNPGPVGLLVGDGGRTQLDTALGIMARYSDKKENAVITVYERGSEQQEKYPAVPLPDDELKRMLING